MVLCNWILPHVCWGVWKERNNKMFRDKETKVDIIFHKFLNALMENYTNIKGPIPSLSTKGRENNKRDGCRWSLPLEG